MHDLNPKKEGALAAAALVLCATATWSPAQATCGSANCFLVTGTAEGIQPKESFLVDVSFRSIDQDRRLEGSHGRGEVLTPKIEFEEAAIEEDHHREIRTQNTLAQVDMAWGATDRLTFAASLPLVNDRDHEHFDDVGTPDEFFTREDGASGLGDLRLGARYALLVGERDHLVGALSVELPTGAYRLRDSEGSINEPTIQPGSGSYDCVAALHYAHQWIPHRLETFVAASAKVSAENDLDYRFGAESSLNAGVSFAPGARLTWSLQVNARWTGRDEYLGEQVPSTGAALVNLTPGLRITTGAGSSLYLFVQTPVFQDVNEAQLGPRRALMPGFSRSFS